MFGIDVYNATYRDASCAKFYDTFKFSSNCASIERTKAPLQYLRFVRTLSQVVVTFSVLRVPLDVLAFNQRLDPNLDVSLLHWNFHLLEHLQ